VPVSIPQILQWLVTGGAVAVGAAFISWLGANVPQFGALPTAAKQAIMAGACLVLALAAWAVQTYIPAATLEVLAVPFGIVAATITALLVNQAWFALVQKANPAPPTVVTTTLASGATIAQPVVPVIAPDGLARVDVPLVLPIERKSNGDLRNLVDVDAKG
jgi:hypothetical protein